MVSSILPLLINEVSVRKRGKRLLGPISLDISGAGITVILGPNGAGKTTLLRVMHGLERPHEGEVSWNCETHEAQKKQAFVFQTPIMLRRSVIENVIYPLRLQGHSKSAAISAAHGWLDRINLSVSKNLSASFLSGGERQKLALARALAIKPEVLFLDEPTANLDGGSTREIEAIIKEAASNGIRIIITTHAIGQGKRLANDVVFMHRGLLHEKGLADEFFEKPQTQETASFLNGEIIE